MINEKIYLFEKYLREKKDNELLNKFYQAIFWGLIWWISRLKNLDMIISLSLLGVSIVWVVYAIFKYVKKENHLYLEFDDEIIKINNLNKNTSQIAISDIISFDVLEDSIKLSLVENETIIIQLQKLSYQDIQKTIETLNKLISNTQIIST